MQDQKGALSWTGFLGKLLTFLGAVILVLVILSWLRCSGRTPGGQTVSETVPSPTGVSVFLHNR
ncbi:MAG: hypothetical protein ACM3YF_02675 [Candidatus Zixiibacteriota bacterium]